MKLTGIAGALVMLATTLAACGGNDETKLEHQVRTFLEGKQRYQTVLGVPDDAVLDRITCGKSGRFAVTACEMTFDGVGTERYLVDTASRGGFAFEHCLGGLHGGGFVTGVMAPMTPNGAGSMRTRPWSVPSVPYSPEAAAISLREAK